jgi:protein phosphatase
MPIVGRISSEDDADDGFDGQSSISTSLIHSVSIAPVQRSFARKAFSKMNIDPRWLIYLPSAIASLQSTREDVGLERPESAIGYYRDERIEKVIVEEKHMGSRGIIIVCKTHQAASERFGVSGEIPGCVYTRNGRRFFKNEDTEAVFLERLGRVLNRANFWKRFDTDFFCFDGEILPWSVKASESSEESDLVESGELVLSETHRALGVDPESHLRRHWSGVIAEERIALERYDAMFKRYRAESANLSDLRFAPFHLLAVEGHTFFDRSHLWHMQLFSRLGRSGGGFLIPTRYEIVNTTDARTWAKTLLWWDELSAKGSEGFVVKPLPFVPRGRRGLAQPSLKCRSKEHLRLVYGPKYDAKEVAEVLIARNSLSHRRNKHRRILKQFALPMEAVSRFVKRSPMDAVLECVLGVLAQEVPPIVRA